MNWNDLTPLEQTRVLYSDLHKDVYGYRPRGFSHLSLEVLEEMVAHLDAEIEKILAEQEEDADPDAWKKYV